MKYTVGYYIQPLTFLQKGTTRPTRIATGTDHDIEQRDFKLQKRINSEPCWYRISKVNIVLLLSCCKV